MDADEREICNYLKSFPGQFVSNLEIARRAAGRRRFERDPDWHLNPINRLLEAGVIDADSDGRYRIKPPPPRAAKPKRWISPQIRRILQAHGKFTHLLEEDDGDEAVIKLFRDRQWDSGKK